jgi:hypothetical protein
MNSVIFWRRIRECLHAEETRYSHGIPGHSNPLVCFLIEVRYSRSLIILLYFPFPQSLQKNSRTLTQLGHNPVKLALTSQTSGGCSVGIVRSRTKAKELVS